jgi:hypothetical protein
LSEYVVLKLCTGEQLFGEVLNETLDGISITDPIQVKSIPMMDNNEYVEQIISNRFCAFSKDRHFTFNYKDIIYCKDLNPAIVKYYKKLVLAFGEETFQMESFYKEASQEEVEKIHQELSTKSIKIH